VKLRICDGEFERIVAATAALIDEAFALAGRTPGTEITLAADGRWLSATALPLTDQAVYLMAGGPGLGVISMGRTAWNDARGQFHAFLVQETAEAGR
jgi:hypothetical protein